MVRNLLTLFLMERKNLDHLLTLARKEVEILTLANIAIKDSTLKVILTKNAKEEKSKG
jgi:hypothetical protein